MHLPRHAELWLAPYVADRCRRLLTPGPRPTKVWLTIADHFEPLRGQASLATGLERVRVWRDRWPEIARAAPADAAGRPPQYTFFYPEEEYRPELLEPLAEMAHANIADIEVHIHHDREARETFIQRMTGFCKTLRNDHDLLREEDGRIVFGFIHGNWALDNSLPNGKWCGLNDEITILRDLGCYADFTMPSGSSESQARTINRIYWCTDDPKKPKSYDQGIPVELGIGRSGDLLIVPGPLGLRRGDHLMPRMETGEIAAYDAITKHRVSRWFDLSPRVGSNVFIKLYAHGALESNAATMLGGELGQLFKFVHEEADRRGMEFVYSTAWQMYEAILGLCKGRDPSVKRMSRNRSVPLESFSQEHVRL
jgi:hypothetical protein